MSCSAFGRAGGRHQVYRGPFFSAVPSMARCIISSEEEEEEEEEEEGGRCSRNFSRNLFPLLFKNSNYAMAAKSTRNGMESLSPLPALMRTR